MRACCWPIYALPTWAYKCVPDAQTPRKLWMTHTISRHIKKRRGHVKSKAAISVTRLLVMVVGWTCVVSSTAEGAHVRDFMDAGAVGCGCCSRWIASPRHGASVSLPPWLPVRAPSASGHY